MGNSIRGFTGKSVLNKLTPERFEKLTKALAGLPITCADDLKLLANEVFEKAVSEHGYCEMYSDMCMVLRSKYPEFPDPRTAGGDGAKFNFTRALLNRAQIEFNNLPRELPEEPAFGYQGTPGLNGTSPEGKKEEKTLESEENIGKQRLKERLLGRADVLWDRLFEYTLL